MNLNDLVNGAVDVVNPPIQVTIQKSTGYTTSADGTQLPAYQTVIATARCQALTYNDLQQVSGLNTQGRRQALYIDGDWEGLIRADQKGGDVITFPDGSVWLCAMVLEAWSITAGWTKICVTLQNGS